MKPDLPAPAPQACEACPIHDAAMLHKLGVDMDDFDFAVALAGNPNTGKSTVFNALTGLRQHTGNWPGKTVGRAEGAFAYNGRRYKMVDLPGTYSLLSASPDEEIARDFILFGRPDVVVVVVDATRLERNLNLALQVMEITDRVVVCLNLIDEAERNGLHVDARRLARDLGIPVVPTTARRGDGLPDLLRAVHEVATGRTTPRPHRIENQPPALKRAIRELSGEIEAAYPDLPNARWLALRLLDSDNVLEKMGVGGGGTAPDPHFFQLAQTLRWGIGANFHEGLVEALYAEAARIADRAVTPPDEPPRFDWDRTLDRIVTHRTWGFLLMIILLAGVFWLTITGANYPSQLLSYVLLEVVHPWLNGVAATAGIPWWLSGLLIDGIYLATGWVVSVMLPPMAIFFPLFTLLEDFGYLPRVAFNLDHLFRKAGAHGRQALSMSMGFGCNAAGVVATRIIDSPRERLIAILTNNFSLCNGRWPTQILIASLFIGGLAPAYLAGLISAVAVVGIALLGVLLTFAVSWALSRTWLTGQVSTFNLELPPYRPPDVLRTIYTSLIDRTLIVLWRAVVFAAPAGAVIWLSANVQFAGASLAEHLIRLLDPVGLLIGLNGVILLAFVVAIPANEIVIPTVLMYTVLVTGAGDVGAGTGVMFELESRAELLSLFSAGGWTLLTAVNLMLFSLIHNPCSTTLYTIYRETKSRKWTAVAALLPLGMGFLVTFTVAQVWRLFT